MARPNQELIAAIRVALRSEADPTRAASAQAYMKSEMPFLGVPVPRVRAITRALCRKHPMAGFSEYRETVRTLFTQAKFREERYAAMGVAGAPAHRSMQTIAALPLYRRLIVEGAWWDLVDELSCRVGEVLANDPVPTAKALRKWAHGDNLWLRRAAILCQRKRKQETDLGLLVDCIEPALGEPEFFLQKAIGWALRSVAWHDPDWTLAYVRERATELSPLSQREALKNLPREGTGPSRPGSFGARARTLP